MLIAWALIYNVIVLPVLCIMVLLASLFNVKIRDGLKGRFRSFSTLRSCLLEKDMNKDIYWFHVASHGEFQQALPVIEGLKEIDTNCLIFVSFFSPSGFNNVSNELIDCKFYLPLDFIWTINRTINLIICN